MDVIIDRFEDGYAVVEAENRKMYHMDADLLPGAKEGDKVTLSVSPCKPEDKTAALFKKLLKDK